MNSIDKDIRLEKVGFENMDKLIDLEIYKSQYDFVADNCYSLAEAFVNITKMADMLTHLEYIKEKNLLDL